MRWFVKTFDGDAVWFRYLLRSLIKFDPNHTIVIVEDAQKLAPEAMQIADGYMRQQYIKLIADHFVPEPHVQVDSDMILLRPPVAEDFFSDGGGPLWFHREWAEVGDAKCWRPITQKALGFDPPYEFMTRPGFYVTPEDLKATREAIEREHKMPLVSYLASQGRAFSEYNAIGATLWNERRASRTWRKPSDGLWGLPSPLIEQAWSWGGLDAARRERYEAILGLASAYERRVFLR